MANRFFLYNADSQKAKVVISGRYMLKINGLELFFGIQTDPALKDTSFLMITMEHEEDKKGQR